MLSAIKEPIAIKSPMENPKDIARVSPEGEKLSISCSDCDRGLQV